MHQNSAAYFLTNFEDISSFWSTTVHSFWLFFEQFFAILKHFVTGFRSFFNRFLVKKTQNWLFSYKKGCE